MSDEQQPTGPQPGSLEHIVQNYMGRNATGGLREVAPGTVVLMPGVAPSIEHQLAPAIPGLGLRRAAEPAVPRDPGEIAVPRDTAEIEVPREQYDAVRAEIAQLRGDPPPGGPAGAVERGPGGSGAGPAVAPLPTPAPAPHPLGAIIAQRAAFQAGSTGLGRRSS